ncbi:MAG: hypothetical protein WD771_00515 [Gemmatimonadaceae bacterium]
MTQSIPLASDARERFLLEIAKVIPAERIDEVHFFQPLRQGPLETGVAVIAALPDAPDADAPLRHVVYSARYRWTRKGPDRGKWESEIRAEADAPLVTVDAVVEGVMRRVEEAFDPEKVDGDAARTMIADAERRCQSTP